MSIDEVGSKVGLVARTQPGGDLENSWIMFDNVKQIIVWTTMAYHVYDLIYYKVMTIAICNMQSKNIEAR
jgi:hypothetical protein